MNRGHVSFHHPSPLMIIHDFNVKCVAALPGKTYTPLIINADAVLPFSVTSEPLQMISRRNAQEIECFGGVNLREFSKGHLLNGFWKLPGKASIENPFCFLASERFNHGCMLTHGVSIVKQY